MTRRSQRIAATAAAGPGAPRLAPRSSGSSNKSSAGSKPATGGAAKHVAASGHDLMDTVTAD